MIITTSEYLEKEIEFFSDVHLKKSINLFAFDEAHTAVLWKDDFRQTYKNIKHNISTIFKLNRPPILAMTATAPPSMQAAIIQSLGMDNPEQFIDNSFSRGNIYLNRKRRGHFNTYANLANELYEFLVETGTKQTGYKYTTKKSIHFFSNIARANLAAATLFKVFGIKSSIYHGESKSKNSIDDFESGKTTVLLATNSVSQGIDIKDVEIVTISGLFKDPGTVIQSIGRAGRGTLSGDFYFLIIKRYILALHEIE